jgi:hypothetical protein
MMQRWPVGTTPALPMVAVRCCPAAVVATWLSLVTDVDTDTARNLVDSMSNEVVVTENSIADLVPGKPMGYDEAVREAFRIAPRRSASRLRSRSDPEHRSVRVRPFP